MTLTRRRFLAGAMAAPFVGAKASQVQRADVMVIGAGVFGAWTASKLLRQGRKVLLLDAYGAANSRASSGGESRMTRAAYGADSIYSQMALSSLIDWKALSDYAHIPLFHPTGVLSFFAGPHPQAQASMQTMQTLGLRYEQIEAGALRKRWPQVDWQGVEYALLEQDFGALMARRAVMTLVSRFVADGGHYAQTQILPPAASSPSLHRLVDTAGKAYEADKIAFACGPWLGKLFPDLLAQRLFVTRQSVFYFHTGKAADTYRAASMPGWADFSANDILYGFPDLEGRGFKIANDKHGEPADPDVLSRTITHEEEQSIRAYLGKRFPRLASQPLAEARVCQYENSSNGDFLIDWHPQWKNTLLVGMGSGHGFKHGPAVGDLAANMLTQGKSAEARFSLASKQIRQARSVH